MGLADQRLRGWIKSLQARMPNRGRDLDLSHGGPITVANDRHVCSLGRNAPAASPPKPTSAKTTIASP
jgi:hypothetical protein